MPSFVSAQVIIKEKVEINPQTINPDYQVSSLDPCPIITRPQYYQTVYSCSGFPIEPYQQLYPFQSGTFLIFNPIALYDAEIISGTDYAYFERVEYIDSTGNFYPYETFGTLLSGLTGAELSGTGNFIGYEGAGTFERENSTVYRVRFDNYSLPEASVIIRIKNLNDNIFTDWHTLIVNPDLRFVNQQYEADTLLHYYSKDVTPKFINANSPCSHPGYGGCPPDNVTFNIEVIEGQQYGSIKNFETNEIATSFTGLSYNNLNTTFTYYANGVQPDSTATVRIRHSSNDPEIIPQEFSFTVQKNTIPPPSEGGSIYVKIDKQVVIPGDTVNVQLRWIDAVGDTVEFSQIQRFKVDLAEGSEYGTILDAETGDTSDTFTEIANEFKVIVAPQIESETAKIVLVAEADLIIFTRPVRINNGTKIANQLQKNSVDKVDDEGGTNTDFIIIGNHLVGVGEITITKTPFIIEIVPAVVSAGDTAQIIPMKLNPDGTTTPFDTLQTFEIGMLDGCPLGYLSAEADSNNYFYGVTQPFYFIADSSADSGTVNIRVGVIETNQQNRSLTNNNNIIPESDNPVSCANVSFEENLYANANVVVGNECDEEIVVCETLEPQELKNESFIKLRRNKDYDWIDKGGVPHTSNTGNGCLFQPRTDGRLDMGKCYVFEIIGNYAASSSYPYYLLDDAKIKACINKNDPAKPHWQFNLENLKIPVFADICQEEFPDYYVDLIDGTLAHCLSKITRCEEVKYLFEDIEFLEIGPYRQPNKNQKYPFYYSNGILAHEDAHYDQTIKEVVKYFKEQKIFENIRHDYVEIFQSSYPCPEDAINFVEKLIKQDLRNAILAGSDLYIRMGYNEKEKEYQAELDADEIARKTYEQIRTNLNLIRSYLHCN